MCQKDMPPTQSQPVLRDRKMFYLQEEKKSPALLHPSHVPKSFSRSNLEVPKEFKKSVSFGGFSGFKTDANEGVSREEIENLLDEKNKEVNTVAKEQIKVYAVKYSAFKEPFVGKPWYREILAHTQPAHFFVMVLATWLAFRLFPDSRRTPHQASTFTRLVYVLSVSAVFGTQFWMTFVSGLALFFSVPRHVFAQVQSVIFPLYFLISSLFKLVAAFAYYQLHPWEWAFTHQQIQGYMLVGGFVLNGHIWVFYTCHVTSLIKIKMAIEKEAGLGDEIGSSGPGSLSKCPHYMRLFKAFRRKHFHVALANMAAMALTCFHIYYLAIRLCADDK